MIFMKKIYCYFCFIIMLVVIINFTYLNDSIVKKSINSKIYMNTSDYINFDSKFKIDYNKKIIDKVSYNTTSDDIKNSISTNGVVNMYYRDNNPIIDNVLVGTGYKVMIQLSSGNQEYLISVKGDSNGDGNVDVLDIIDIVDNIIYNKKTEDIYYSASDYNEDNSIDVLDIISIVDLIVDNSYTDKINGYRCYTDGNSKVLYYITECQVNNSQGNKCRYKETSENSNTTVLRSKLSDASTCNGNIIGSTGYSVSNKISLKQSDDSSSNNILTLQAGYPFKILDSNSDDTWWKVEYQNKIGYVENKYMMINLPDYIPTMQFNLMNANNNIYTASGFKLSIYGEKLYTAGKVYNYRLEREEYIAPVVYSFAKKILEAQKIANREGYNLKIYDAYRPKSVADRVRDSLANLYNNNTTVKQGIDYSYENGKTVYWGQSWFIAQSLSRHSLGVAIDVVLTDKETGEEIVLQSSLHDLSTASVKYNTPVSGQTTVRNDLYSSKANKHTKDLDRIMLSTGMTNLASEWWHFQDNGTASIIKNLESNGLDFQVTSVVSSKK